jgi:hypothetical protein
MMPLGRRFNTNRLPPRTSRGTAPSGRHLLSFSVDFGLAVRHAGSTPI